jgi:hypothetical protein
MFYNNTLYFEYIDYLFTFDLLFEVLAALNMSGVVFWVVTSCGLVDSYYRFGEIYSPQLEP